MPLWHCSIENCHNPSVRVTGDCTICNRHLCYEHLKPTFHKCPTLDDEEDYYPAYANAEQEEIETLGQKINYAAPETHAMALRPGILCHASPLRFDRQTKHEVMGGMNIHVNVEFQDGVTWLARIRRSNATSPPPVVRDYITSVKSQPFNSWKMSMCPLLDYWGTPWKQTKAIMWASDTCLSSSITTTPSQV
ncbi:hypothetical protein D6D28_04537 [Aureobasidium pullulans]|uniref:AN1-type domain-containing protein n=1 Tax=Aureobasidium pullulans TaxID=5580 RepID=A0A4S8SKX8_AURPU|nr:hypothetical protein D6D28_04537 [Aureobasidium pullulans]